MGQNVLTPANASAQIAQIQSGFMQAAGAAAAQGNPAGVAAASSALAIITTTNIALTAASGVPGGMSAANIAYGKGIKTSLAASAASVFSAIAGMADTHMCPIPCPILPHGPGMVQRGLVR